MYRYLLLVSAFMNNNLELLKVVCKDKFHQEYRRPLINDYDKVVTYSNKLNWLGNFLSVAGPTIISLTSADAKDCLHNIELYLLSLNNK